MYQLFVEEHFDAAHYLRNYHGKCENLHGHRFKVVVCLEATKLGESGLAYDFTQIKHHLREAIAQFDHSCLNDIPPFDKTINPSETIAATIYNQRINFFSKSPAKLARTEVWESPTSGAAYIPDKALN